MRIEELIEGLQIIARAQPGTDVDIHSDTLFAGAYGRASIDDAARLDDLGWDEDEECWALRT